MIKNFENSRQKSQARILQENIDRERKAFAKKESAQILAEKAPLTQLHNMDTYDAIQKKLELREQESEYLVDERDAVEGEVTDSDAEFEAIVAIDQLIKEISDSYNNNVQEETELKAHH